MLYKLFRTTFFAQLKRFDSTFLRLPRFIKFTGKHLCQSNFIKKETLAQVFSCKFYEISKNTFFTERLPTTTAF